MSDANRKNADPLGHYLDELRAQIPQTTPAEARRLADEGAVIIDIREPWEMGSGTVPGALLIERGMLEMSIGNRMPDLNQPMILLCAGGDRSTLSAASLARMGYAHVSSLEGGFSAWQEAGLPTTMPKLLDDRARSRYLRHLPIAEVGEAGQQKLLESRVFITGAGGLGSPAALYLAAAGVGQITLIDNDRVERSNLQRQILHSDHLIGHLKTESAAQRLHALNPDIDVISLNERLDEDNAVERLRGHDVVIDGSDNFPTRYLLNDACIRLGLPLVYGAVLRFSGQIGVFRAGDGQAPCYRCLFPYPPHSQDAPNCAEAGVLGVMPGVIGTLQAAETLKLLLDIGEPLISRLVHYDALAATFRTSRLVRDPECRYCAVTARSDAD